jgi:hypothetical protein
VLPIRLLVVLNKGIDITFKLTSNCIHNMPAILLGIVVYRYYAIHGIEEFVVEKF